MLKEAEELALARRWRESGDRTAVEALVTSHLRLVARMATQYRGYGVPLSELVSEGTIGLMRAVERFDPDRGFRLTTYAVWWIKSAIHEHILRSWSVVRMGRTAKERKLFFNLRKAKRRVAAFEEGDMHPDHVEAVARDLMVTEQDVIDMNRRLGRDASLNTPVGDDDGPGDWQDWLVDDHENQEAVIARGDECANRRQALGEALALLNPRERRIFERRRLADEPMSLAELGREFRVSGERVRQIDENAFKKVQKAVRARIASEEDAVDGGVRAALPPVQEAAAELHREGGGAGR
jgi:RNA polymerase sigma-32 factor